MVKQLIYRSNYTKLLRSSSLRLLFAEKVKGEEKDMNKKRGFTTLAIAMFLASFFLYMTIASPGPNPGEAGPYVDQLWYELITNPDAALTALLTHTVDQGGVPRPADLPTLKAAGFTITTTVRIGYTMFFENNFIDPLDDINFRKGINRLIDKDYIVENIYAPLMGECEYYLPPPSSFVNPDAPAPTFNPGSSPTETGTGTAASYLNEGGYTMGTTVNPNYDGTYPWSAPYLRINPDTEADLAPIEYTTRTSLESPLAYEMSLFMTEYLEKAGLQIDLVPKTWSEFIFILTNDDYYDYELLTGVGIVWGTKSPDILYDFLQSEQVPLWNVWNYADEEMDYWASILKGTLSLTEFEAAAKKMQELAVRDEPYLPLLLWNQFTASTGPYGDEPGMDALVNHRGIGTINNFWSPLFSRREAPRKPIIKRIMGAEMTTHNPLMANTVPDWRIMTPCIGGTFATIPYVTGEDYYWFGHREPPVQAEWVGPDGTEGTADDGMVTTFKIRDDIYWDDGTKVTTADWEFTMEMLSRQDNVRYRSYWQYYYNTTIIDAYTWKEFATERFIYRFENLDIGFLTPKHIWEPFIAGEDGILWTADDRHHSEWYGWEEDGPSPGGSKLLGIGPFIYPKDNWQPTSSYISANRDWWGGKICLGDVDLSRLTELPDLSLVLDAQGCMPGMPVWEKSDAQSKVEMLGPAADIVAPAQIVSGAEISTVIGHFGHEWGPGYTPE